MKRLIRHKRPADSTIRKVVTAARYSLAADPLDASASYRRGVLAALQWVLGEDARFDRDQKRSRKLVAAKKKEDANR